VTLEDLFAMLENYYEVNARRSRTVIKYPLKHLRDYFDPGAKAVTITTDRLNAYIATRLRERAAPASVRNELALIGKAFTLAVRARRLRTKPFIPKPEGEPSRVRQGFFTREEVRKLCAHLDPALADVVHFLFFSAWRIGEIRSLEWKDYFPAEQTIRLRPEHSKNKSARILPMVGELANIIDVPNIFHRNGQPIGDFRKRWAAACKAIGVSGRIVHDLRRSGVRHLIQAGVDPHTVMAFSGHKTRSMLKRYHIIALDDLRRAAERGSNFTETGTVVSFPERTRRERAE
jgi:integrase